MLSLYSPMFVFIACVLLIGVAALSIGRWVAPHRPDEAKRDEGLTPEECEAQVMGLVSILPESSQSKPSAKPAPSTAEELENTLEIKQLYLFNQPLICGDINSLMFCYPFDDEEASNDRAVLAENSDLNLG